MIGFSHYSANIFISLGSELCVCCAPRPRPIGLFLVRGRSLWVLSYVCVVPLVRGRSAYSSSVADLPRLYYLAVSDFLIHNFRVCHVSVLFYIAAHQELFYIIKVCSSKGYFIKHHSVNEEFVQNINKSDIIPNR